ncbi:MAG: penicillin-insensitive murein endopeptidase [Myxococcota bacterium]
MRRALVTMVGALALACLAQAARATPQRADPYRWPGARELPKHSRSMGWPWRGRLDDGVRVVESKYVRHTTEYTRNDHFYGTWELVQLVERAAWRVWSRIPGARLSVGELSAENGGDIPDHRSHENGRDVDIAFYMLDGRGEPFEPYAFASFDARGRGMGPNRGLRFDDARNWELIAKLIADGDARVQYIFVHRTIKRRLLAEGRRRGAPAVLLERAEKVMVQPSRHGHRNHFHVRIYCPPASRPACKDRAPFHAWYPGNPPTVASARR